LKKIVVVLLMIVLVAGAVGVSACAAPTAAGEVKIGTVLPLTGMFTGFGEGNAFGMQAAVDDINAQGGLDVGGKKMKVKLIILDSESDSVKVGSLAEDLMAREKINYFAALGGPITGWAGAAIAGEKYKIPSCSGVSPMEPWAGMRMEATPPWEYNWLAGFAIATPPDKGDFRDKPGYTLKDTWLEFLDAFAAQTNRVAGVFATDEPDGRAWYGLFPGLLQGHGEKVVGMEKNLGLVPIETTDFSSVIKEWQANNVEILWGNCPGPVFGALWKQAKGMGFKPKICSFGRAPLFYVDASSWGGDLAYGVGTEMFWSPTYTDCPGIGGTTPQSLAERWAKEKKQPLNPAIGPGYGGVQIGLEAIKQAGSLDGTKINAVFPTLDMPSIDTRVKFNNDHFSRQPIVFGQWFKVETPEKLELKVVLSDVDFVPVQAKPIFPLP
jgi:branched-chain amino acid transport system substrate-binding protein